MSVLTDAHTRTYQQLWDVRGVERGAEHGLRARMLNRKAWEQETGAGTHLAHMTFLEMRSILRNKYGCMDV